MKILVFYPYVPWPLDRGTYQRTFNLLKALASEHTVDFLALTSDLEAAESKRPVFEVFCNDVEFLHFEHGPWPRLFPKRLLNPLPSNVAHWQDDHIAKRLNEKLASGDYDLVHVCDLALAPYVAASEAGVPFVIDRSRVDLQFQLMEHRNLDLPARDRLLRWESYLKLWRYEKRMARKASLEVVCGPDDETFVRRHIDRRAPVKVIPNGVDLGYFTPEATREPRDPEPTLIFCGAMDYSPNTDALRWFFETMHQSLLERVPDVKVLVVGKQPTPEVKAYAQRQGVEVTGGVPDVRPYYRRAWMQMVPLRIGGGTRLKIVESLAIGTPVVSTRIGAQGLELDHGKNVLLADTPDAFVEQLVRGLQDSQLRKSLEESGMATAWARFGWPSIGKELAEHYQALLSA